MSIRLSKKHGVNPSILVCPCCQSSEGMGLALLGRHTNKKTRDYDAEAPRYVLGNEPCDECKDYMKQGIIFIEVEDGSEGMKNPPRKSGFWVLREEAVKQMINPQLLEAVLKQRVTYIPESAANDLGLPRPEE